MRSTECGFIFLSPYVWLNSPRLLYLIRLLVQHEASTRNSVHLSASSCSELYFSLYFTYCSLFSGQADIMSAIFSSASIKSLFMSLAMTCLNFNSAEATEPPPQNKSTITSFLDALRYGRIWSSILSFDPA